MSSHVHRLSFMSRAALLAGSALLGLTGFGALRGRKWRFPSLKSPAQSPSRNRVPCGAAYRRRPSPRGRRQRPASHAGQCGDREEQRIRYRAQQPLHHGRHDVRHAQPRQPSRRCRKAPMRRSRKFCCKHRACRRISAASGSIHVRNDHANVQFRINGVMLPDGVTGFGSILDPSLIGSMSLITGALPAEFGMRTVGLVDITTRNDIFNNSGSISLYGGSRGTFQPSFEYGGTFGNTCPSTTPAATNSSAAPARHQSSTVVLDDRLFPRRAIPVHRPLSADHRRHRKSARRPSTPFTTSRSRPKASPTCRPSSTR